jgi:hypothetical protein
MAAGDWRRGSRDILPSPNHGFNAVRMATSLDVASIALPKRVGEHAVPGRDPLTVFLTMRVSGG